MRAVHPATLVWPVARPDCLWLVATASPRCPALTATRAWPSATSYEQHRSALTSCSAALSPQSLRLLEPAAAVAVRPPAARLADALAVATAPLVVAPQAAQLEPLWVCASDEQQRLLHWARPPERAECAACVRLPGVMRLGFCAQHCGRDWHQSCLLLLHLKVPAYHEPLISAYMSSWRRWCCDS